MFIFPTWGGYNPYSGEYPVVGLTLGANQGASCAQNYQLHYWALSGALTGNLGLLGPIRALTGLPQVKNIHESIQLPIRGHGSGRSQSEAPGGETPGWVSHLPNKASPDLLFQISEI